MVIVAVIAIYFYMRHTTKRRRASDIDSIKQYHNNYKRKRTRNTHGSDHTYRTYVTKYNSTEDYRERR